MYQLLFLLIVIVIIIVKYNITKETWLNYQHNRSIIVTPTTHKYIYQYKKQLLKNITRLLNDLQIKFVISHGNLLEFERRETIYQDDDLDIRFDCNDWNRWDSYCLKPKNKNNPKYNLIFDNRFTNIKQQQLNGIQCRLIHFNNPHHIKCFTMDIHCDLVNHKINSKTWIYYDINFSQLRPITYLGINTWAPNKKDSIRMLKKDYGTNYLIPDKKQPHLNNFI